MALTRDVGALFAEAPRSPHDIHPAYPAHCDPEWAATPALLLMGVIMQGAVRFATTARCANVVENECIGHEFQLLTDHRDTRAPNPAWHRGSRIRGGVPGLLVN
jgi:hypothetical protein